MKEIKFRYFIVFGIFVGLFLFFAYFIYCHTNFNDVTKLSQMIQMFIGFAAVTSAIIALAIADKAKAVIKLRVEVYALTGKLVGVHKKSELTDELQKQFASFPDQFNSHQVYFKITNYSGFTLNNPTFTARLDKSLLHPNQKGNGLEFRTNMFNSSKNIQQLEFADTIVISNSNLNFLNDREWIKIWIRICLPIDEYKKIIFRVSLNSENAEGKTYKVVTTKSELLYATEKKHLVGITN